MNFPTREEKNVVSEGLETVSATIGSRILRFIGVSGWLLFPILLLENRVAVTLNGSNAALDLLMGLTILLWITAKLETKFRDWWDRKQD